MGKKKTESAEAQDVAQVQQVEILNAPTDFLTLLKKDRKVVLTASTREELQEKFEQMKDTAFDLSLSVGCVSRDMANGVFAIRIDIL